MFRQPSKDRREYIVSCPNRSQSPTCFVCPHAELINLAFRMHIDQESAAFIALVQALSFQTAERQREN